MDISFSPGNFLSLIFVNINLNFCSTKLSYGNKCISNFSFFLVLLQFFIILPVSFQNSFPDIKDFVILSVLAVKLQFKYDFSFYGYLVLLVVRFLYYFQFNSVKIPVIIICFCINLYSASNSNY